MKRNLLASQHADCRRPARRAVIPGKLLMGVALLAILACGAPAPSGSAGSAAAPSKPAGQAAAATPAAAPPAPGQPAAAAPPPAAGAADRWQQMLEAGKKEGAVVVAGSPLPSLRQAYSEQFPKDTGIELQYLAVPTAELTTRAEREALAGRPSMDVIVSGGGELYTLLPKGLLEPVTSLLVMPEVVDPTAWKGDRGIKWMDKDRQYVPVGTSWVMTDLFINTNMVPPGSIKSWKDLLDPRWKGKIISSDPRGGGPGQATARYLLVKFGDQFVVDLYKGQEAVLVRDQRQVAEGVARGTYPIGLGAIQFDVEEFRKAGLPIAREFPPDGPGSLVGGFSALKIVKNAPNPNAAAVFLNWALSKSGQTAYQQALMEPSLRKDVTTDNLPPYVVPNPTVTYDVDQYEYDFYINTAPKLGEQLVELLGR
jgi:iron(III) transport system substrate-binding protein